MTPEPSLRGARDRRIAELEAKNAILEAAISVANARKALQPDTAVEEK